jgi:hypothetical protein
VNAEIATVGGNETVGITHVTATQADQRFYNLNGQQVQSLTKGLYIKNGKKFIVR